MKCAEMGIDIVSGLIFLKANTIFFHINLQILSNTGCGNLHCTGQLQKFFAGASDSSGHASCSAVSLTRMMVDWILACARTEARACEHIKKKLLEKGGLDRLCTCLESV